VSALDEYALTVDCQLFPARELSSHGRKAQPGGLLVFKREETLRMTTLYVGNLPFSATDSDVKALFERHGKVESVKLINDRETGRPRGFGFVDMPSSDAQAAVQALNGFQMGGRPLRVNEAQERPRQGGGPFRR
jgi:RNA recognition motif-containing protein